MKRDIRLDALKGIVSLLVVLSHAMQDFPARGNYVPLRFLTFVDMPLFMLLTGYALGYSRDRSPRAQIIHRAKTLLIPYVAWGLLAPLLYGEAPGVFMTFTGRSGPWFLLAVFVFEVALVGLKRFTRNPWLLVGCAWMAGMTAYGIADIPALSSFRVVDDVAHFFLFYVVGHVAFHVLPALSAKRKTVALASSSMFATAGLSLLAYLLMSRAGSAPWAEVAISVAIETARLSIGLSAGIIAVLAVRAVREDRLGTFARLGTMSLGIYLIHIYLRHRVTGSGWATVVVVFLVWATVSILGTLIIQRQPLLNALLLGGRPPPPK